MQITTSIRPQAFHPASLASSPSASVASQEQASSGSLPAEAYLPGGARIEEKSPSFLKSFNKSDLAGTAVLGGIALAGSALGAYGGYATGALAGIAGCVAGVSAGATLGMQTPGEHIKLGALAGGLAGTLVGALAGGTAPAVVMGLAGATLPFGLIGLYAASR